MGADTGGGGIPVYGVTPLEHTADLGIEVVAPDPGGLFRRATAGMTWLLLERLPKAMDRSRDLRVRSNDVAGLLRGGLREILYWHEAEAFVPAEVEVRRMKSDRGAAALDATVRGSEDRQLPVREIKGVTLHGLVAEPRGDEWYGRVIFDV